MFVYTYKNTSPVPGHGLNTYQVIEYGPTMPMLVCCECLGHVYARSTIICGSCLGLVHNSSRCVNTELIAVCCLTCRRQGEL